MKTLWLCMIYLLVQFQTGICVNHYNTSLCRPDQKQLLLHLSHNLLLDQSDGYYKTKYWNESLDCCDWDGVTCDASTGFVVALDLSSSGLTGNIPSNSTLFRLTHLQKLNLAFNDFNGSQISSEFGWLTSLTHLNLSRSRFGGPIPNEFYYLSNLISLDISLNFKTYCDLKLLSGNMTKMEVLLLSETNTSSEIPTNMSSYLTHLDLGFTGLHGNLPTSFFERPKLQVLRLHGNEGLEGSLPSTLNGTNVYSFRELDLWNTSLTGRLPESIGLSNNLFHLNLRQTSISGKLPDSIGQLNNLVLMDLSSTSISGRLPESIGMLNNLVSMDLSFTNISGRLPESIGLLKNLVQMDITKCNLWGPIPESIGNITKIQSMDMSYNNLSGEIPTTISNLRQIQRLALSDNHLGGQIPDAFANLHNIVLLYLEYNNFVGEIPASISNMSQLRYLDISVNALTGSFPSKAGNLLQNLFYLDLSYNFLQEYLGLTYKIFSISISALMKLRAHFLHLFVT